MDKVVIDEKVRKNAEFDYNGTKIEVIPYISVVDEIALISDYIQRYFRPNEDSTFSYMQKNDFDFWQAEYALIQRVMDTMTNVDTVETKADEMVEIFYIAVKHIDNYYQFRDRLDETIQAIKDSKSVGNIIDNLSNKGFELIQSLSVLDPEKIKELTQELIQNIEQSPIAKNVISEANQNKQLNKSKTKNKKEQVTKE